MSWEDKEGEGIWKERVNTVTGESSIKLHKVKVVKKYCDKKKHDWVAYPRAGEMECAKCGMGKNFRPGRDKRFRLG